MGETRDHVERLTACALGEKRTVDQTKIIVFFSGSAIFFGWSNTKIVVVACTRARHIINIIVESNKRNDFFLIIIDVVIVSLCDYSYKYETFFRRVHMLGKLRDALWRKLADDFPAMKISDVVTFESRAFGSER